MSKLQTPPLAVVNLSHEGECTMEKKTLKQQKKHASDTAPFLKPGK